MIEYDKSEDDRFILPPEPHDPARAIANLIESRKEPIEGQIRPENLLSAAAAVTGEFCLRVAGGVNPQEADLTPGRLILSDKVNQLLFAGQADWAALPPNSVFGTIRNEALYRGYAERDFPSIPDILQLIGDKAGEDDPAPAWGRVPLDVGPDHLPKISPLQDAYLLRKPVAAQLANWGVPLRDQAATCGRTTALLLGRMRGAIDPKIALQIVFATVNGMARMAPMTKKHMAEMQLRVGKTRYVF